MKTSSAGFAIALIASLAACGGGGGSSSGSNVVSVIPTTAPTVSPTPASSATVTGKVTDAASGLALANFVVSVGAVPATTNCVQTNTTNSCGVPVSPTTTTTAADGSFTIAVSQGTQMLTIAPATVNAYATLHRTITGATALGTIKLTALSSDQQAWLADVNALRASFATPTSYANLTVDEYAEEQATKWANDVAAGITVYSDAAYGPYQAAYVASPGAMYVAAGVLNITQPTTAFANTYGSAASGQATLAAGSPGWQASDYAWLIGDKKNCAAPYTWNTAACTANFAVDGHYVNLATTLNVWVGLGMSTTATSVLPGQYAYNVMTIET